MRPSAWRGLNLWLVSLEEVPSSSYDNQYAKYGNNYLLIHGIDANTSWQTKIRTFLNYVYFDPANTPDTLLSPDTYDPDYTSSIRYSSLESCLLKRCGGHRTNSTGGCPAFCLLIVGEGSLGARTIEA